MAGFLKGLSISTPKGDSGDALLTQKIGLLSKLDHKIGPRTSTIHERNQTTEAKTIRAGTSYLVVAGLISGYVLGRNTLFFSQPISFLIDELQCTQSVIIKICLLRNVYSFSLISHWLFE